MTRQMNPEVRRNYIATSRRMQPIEELLRKAKKANRRGFRTIFSGVEGADLSLARSYRWSLERRGETINLFLRTYCSLCGRFSPDGVGFPVRHSVRCSANPIDDGPYPGWHASGVMKCVGWAPAITGNSGNAE